MAKRRQTIQRAKAKRKAAQEAKRTEKAKRRESRASSRTEQPASAEE